MPAALLERRIPLPWCAQTPLAMVMQTNRHDRTWAALSAASWQALHDIRHLLSFQAPPTQTAAT